MHRKPIPIFAFAVIFFFAGAVQAQMKRDTIVKVIYGLHSFADLLFVDPELRVNIIDISVSDPLALNITPKTPLAVPFVKFDIEGLKYGTFIIAAKYHCTKPGSEADSGVEYVKVHVLKENTQEYNGGKGPDVSGIVTVPIRIMTNDLSQLYSSVVYKNLVAFSGPSLFVVRTFGFYETYSQSLWNAPVGRTIVAVWASSGENGVFGILLDDGSIYSCSYDSQNFGFSQPVLYSSPPKKSQGETYYQGNGDDIYIRTSSTLYVTRDLGKTWLPDTSGLNGAYTNNIQLDSSQNVYVATTGGLFQQSPKGNTWQIIASLPIKYVPVVFIDRLDRIFVAGYRTAYMSTDRGATWSADTTGLGTESIGSFGTDAFGNIYATTLGITGPNKLLRSTGGTGAWTEIGQSIRALIVDSTTTNLFHAVTGDSTLSVGTIFGLYTSTDKGNTWSETDLPTVNFYGLVKNSDNSVLLSTNRGIYSGRLGDSNWTKRYPQNGFMNGAPLFQDQNGVIYTTGPQRIINYNSQQPVIYKSVDKGLSWTPDTAGISIIPDLGSFSIDLFGVQHCAVSIYGKQIEIFRKAPGKSWERDEIGFTSYTSENVQSLVSDRLGNTYLSTSNGAADTIHFWVRSVSGVWTMDTTGLNHTIVYSFMGGRGNDLYAIGTNLSIEHLAGTTWNTLPLPSDLSGTISVGAISVDSSGALFAIFNSGPDVSTITKSGVYFTTDNGAHWTLTGLDGITISGLVSYGDTTYALTNQGIFALTRNGVSSVPSTIIPNNSLLISLNPNPSENISSLKFKLPQREYVRVRMVNSLGEITARLYEGEMNSGEQNITLDIHDVPSGNYTVIVEANGIISSVKIVVIH